MNKDIYKCFCFLFITSLLTISLVYICGCAYQKPIVIEPRTEKIIGIYHKVNPGETLWGIAKAYNVSLENIVKINRIPNAARIEKGQLIFIPTVAAKPVSDIDKAALLKDKNFVWPVKGEIISYFGNINNRLNKGIDIKTKSDLNIYAARSGKIVFSDDLKGYGKTIIIDHLDGFFSVYSNNQELLAKLNDNIHQGQIIAKFKNSDESNSFLHFEIRRGYISQNPLYYLP